MPTTRLLIVHALSPVHVGVGQSTAAVDLPIARERATQLPLIPGSSLKGVLRARGRELVRDQHKIETLFGPETERASEHAGSLAFTDARLLLLPVRSVAGTFAWVTSPWLLVGLQRDAANAGIKLPAPPRLTGAESCLTCVESMNRLDLKGTSTVILEDFDLRVQKDPLEPLAGALAGLCFPGDRAWGDLLQKRLCVVHDDVMTYLYTHGTDIVTRVHIDPETGTAMDGQLWSEESLPSESILAGLVEEMPSERTRPARAGDLLEALRQLLDDPLQLGGKATVGKGRCRVHLVSDEPRRSS